MLVVLWSGYLSAYCDHSPVFPAMAMSLKTVPKQLESRLVEDDARLQDHYMMIEIVDDPQLEASWRTASATPSLLYPQYRMPRHAGLLKCGLGWVR
jgi:hypothetical protein